MLKLIGSHCKDFRKSLHIRQIDVARDTGYSLENVAAFENGRNDNLRIFVWYVQHGINLEELLSILEV